MTKADTHLQEHLQFAKADKQTKNCKRACKFSPEENRFTPPRSFSKDLYVINSTFRIKKKYPPNYLEGIVKFKINKLKPVRVANSIFTWQGSFSH